MAWNVSRHIWSRSAGFSSDLLGQLRADETSRLLDEMHVREDHLAATKDELGALLHEMAREPGEARRESRRARRALRSKVEVPNVPVLANDAVRAQWESLRQRAMRLTSELRELQEQLAIVQERDSRESRARLNAVISQGRVRRAAQQSSRSMAAAFAKLGDIPPHSSRRRALERRAVLFVQRLAAKYPILSDLGTCAWGRIEPELREPFRMRPGEGLIAQRYRHIEHWAVRALARALEADPVVQECSRVRLTHGCAFDGRTLYYPIGHRSQLEPLQIQLLRECEARPRLAELRARLASSAEKTALESLLADFLARKVLTTEVPVPTGAHPEQHLLAFVRDLPDECATKASWTARIEAFVALRDEMAGVANGDGEHAAEQRLDEQFTKVTGTAATRGQGAVHGGRFVTYEDTRRDVELSLGGPALHELEQLEPALDIARWIALTCAAAYEQRYQGVFERLAGGLDHVDCVRLMRETQWISEANDIENQVARRVQHAWSEHLGERATGEALVLTPEDLRAVHAALPPLAPYKPWMPAANVHSFGVLPLRAGPDDNYQLVLGRLYKGVPVLVHPVALACCPEPAAVLEDFASWVHGPLLQLADTPDGFHRSNLNLPEVRGMYEVVLPGAYSSYSAKQMVPVGELVVAREDGYLWLQTRDGQLKCPLLTLRWSMLQRKLADVSPFPGGTDARAPRVTMGRWVLNRARWRVPTASLLDDVREQGSLGAARRWKRRLGLPDHIFVRTTQQRKAIYIDLRSLLFADLLVAFARESEEIDVVEMLPAPDQFWMSDREGRSYASELRVTNFWKEGDVNHA